MKEYAGSEPNKHYAYEMCYIVIYYKVLFVYLFFVFVYVCVVVILTKEQINIIALRRK